ncbi:MAG: lysophospholipase [Bacteroidetes bacterium]|nr:MAG: lysophospholipase [Bacteroidota bacterium]
MGRKFFRVCLILVTVYAGLLFLGCGFQRKMIFFPKKLDRDFALDVSDSCREVFFSSTGGAEINALFLKTKSENAVLYLHGNAAALDSWQKIIPFFKKYSAHSLLLIDYRGYGKSTGEISEKGLYDDAQAAYNYLLLQGFKPENIIIYGRSIGTGIATHLAAYNTIHSLVLETPYYNFGKLAHEKMPYLLPRLVLVYRFPTSKLINSVHAPVLILHGTADETIPVHHGKKLFEHYRGTDKKLVIIEGGKHNDLSKYPQFETELRAFLAR